MCNSNDDSNDGILDRVCMPNHIAIRNLKCAMQITHRDVIWRTHGPKYSLSNFYSKCASEFEINNYCHFFGLEKCAVLQTLK